MIAGQTPNGEKGLILRGWLGPNGKKGFAQGSITTPDGDKQFWDGTVGSLTVTASPDIVQGAQAFSGSIPVTTSGTTASASGGSPPYTYAWTLLSDDSLGGDWTAVTPSSATTAFRASSVAPGSSVASFRCTVTDSRGATGTADVSAVATNYGDLFL